MKFRTGFVSNSSTSSFILVGILDETFDGIVTKVGREFLVDKVISTLKSRSDKRKKFDEEEIRKRLKDDSELEEALTDYYIISKGDFGGSDYTYGETIASIDYCEELDPEELLNKFKVVRDKIATELNITNLKKIKELIRCYGIRSDM